MRTFAQLFQGRADCFGIYHVLRTREGDGKQDGNGVSYPNSKYPDRVLTSKDWDKHLNGTQRLGIVPVLPNGTCSWFAIDIDDYSMSHKALVVKIEKSELPLVMCRSKSGGAHLYCFINGYIDAEVAMKLGRKWAIELGYPDVEVFPKQAKPDKGNWIIVPYFGGDKAVDFAFGLQGEQLSVEDFEQWANAKSLQPKEAPAYLGKVVQEPGDMTDDDILANTPPCIRRMMEEGMPEGGRNNSMTHVCVYFQKRDEFFGTDDWRDKVNEFNQSNVEGPMTWTEVATIIRNVSPPGRLQYLCKQEPMSRMCDQLECIKRRFGVGEDKSYYGDIEIMSMVKIDSKPPVWIPRINGSDIEMDTETLLSPRKFRMSIADALNILVKQKVQNKHDDIIGPIMKDALTIEAMDELTTDGKVLQSFNEWTKNMVTKSKDMSDLEKGLPYYDGKSDCIYFRGADFIKEYKRIYRDNVTDRGIWSALRRNDFMRKQVKFQSKPEWIWYFQLDGEEKWFDIEIGEKF